MKDNHSIQPGLLYAKVEEAIKEQILSGKLKVGEKLGSHRELSLEHGVSLITVKQALKHLKDAGYISTHPGKGSYVARSTSRIDHRNYRTIGLIISKLYDPFFSSLVEAIEREAYEAGYNVLLSMSASQRSKGSEQIQEYLEMGIDGLVIASFDQSHKAPSVVYDLHDNTFPYVMISYVADQDIYCVNTDHEEGAYMATMHLLKKGFSQIGYVGISQNDLLNLQRHRGYQRALQDSVVGYDPDLVFNIIEHGGWQRYPSSVLAGKYIAALPKRPNALVTFNDLVAAGIQHGLRESGLSLPEDMAIVGFDGIEFFRSTPFSLTTVVQPVEEMGKKILDVLIKRTKNEATPVRTLLAPSLYIGSSCGTGEETRELLKPSVNRKNMMDSYQGIFSIDS